MAKKLNKNNEFTSFTVIYPELSKALQDGSISNISSTSIPEKYVKVKQLTGKLTTIFKKDDEVEM